MFYWRFETSTFVAQKQLVVAFVVTGILKILFMPQEMSYFCGLDLILNN